MLAATGKASGAALASEGCKCSRPLQVPAVAPRLRGGGHAAGKPARARDADGTTHLRCPRGGDWGERGPPAGGAAHAAGSRLGDAQRCGRVRRATIPGASEYTASHSASSAAQHAAASVAGGAAYAPTSLSVTQPRARSVRSATCRWPAFAPVAATSASKVWGTASTSSARRLARSVAAAT